MWTYMGHLRYSISSRLASLDKRPGIYLHKLFAQLRISGNSSSHPEPGIGNWENWELETKSWSTG